MVLRDAETYIIIKLNFIKTKYVKSLQTHTSHTYYTISISHGYDDVIKERNMTELLANNFS